MRRTRSSSRCSRNVIRSAAAGAGSATRYLGSIGGGGASRTMVVSAGGWAAPDSAPGEGAVAPVSGADGLYFSASTSSSMVRWKSWDALRNSDSRRPMLLPISGRRRGPKTMRARTRMRTSSGPPRGPNMPRMIHSPVFLPGRLLLAAGILGTIPPAAARAEIPVVELDGIVHAVSARHVVSAIDAADASGAPLLVLKLDTPGGLDTSMRQIVDRML